MKGISVIIPTFNRGQFLKEAIDSILNQDYQGPIEIIIADDGSTDSTLDIASSYGNKVIILEKPHNCFSQGASGARNRGILIASNPYISFLDSDDYFLPNHFTKMVKLIESNSNIDFVFCRALEFNNSNSYLFRPWTKNIISEKDIANIVVASIYIVNTNVFLFDRKVFDSVGLFDEEIQVGEDSDLWMRISERFNGVFSDHYGAVIRFHDYIQLTKIPKKKLLKNHFKIFNNAILRYKQLGLNDKYRLWKLRKLRLKYKVSQYVPFYTIYILISKYNDKKKSKNDNWHPLSHFLRTF